MCKLQRVYIWLGYRYVKSLIVVLIVDSHSRFATTANQYPSISLYFQLVYCPKCESKSSIVTLLTEYSPLNEGFLKWPRIESALVCGCCVFLVGFDTTLVNVGAERSGRGVMAGTGAIGYCLEAICVASYCGPSDVWYPISAVPSLYSALIVYVFAAIG